MRQGSVVIAPSALKCKTSRTGVGCPTALATAYVDGRTVFFATRRPPTFWEYQFNKVFYPGRQRKQESDTQRVYMATILQPYSLSRAPGWVRPAAPCGRPNRPTALPHGHSMTASFVGAVWHSRVTAPMPVDGTVNSPAFLADIEQVLAPTIAHGGIVVMNNLPLRKRPAVRDTIEATRYPRNDGCSPQPFAGLIYVLVMPERPPILRSLAASASSWAVAKVAGSAVQDLVSRERGSPVSDEVYLVRENAVMAAAVIHAQVDPTRLNLATLTAAPLRRPSLGPSSGPNSKKARDRMAGAGDGIRTHDT